MTNWLQLTSKTAIITGAGSGIGSAIAKAFTLQGCNTVLVDVNKEHLINIRSQCQDIISNFKWISNSGRRTTDIDNEGIIHGHKPWSASFTCNVTNRNQVNEMFEFADAKILLQNDQRRNEQKIIHPPFASILVNAAGITKDGLIQNISEINYDEVLDTNLKGTFLTCQAFCQSRRLDGLLQNSPGFRGGGGSIINIGSIVSELGNVGQTNYAASKGGVVGLTKALAKEMAFYSNTHRNITNNLTQREQNDNDNDVDAKNCKSSDGSSLHAGVPKHNSNIRVNAILPGFIHTAMTEAVPDQIKERVREKIPLKEFGFAEDVANMALFFASPRSSYVTGAAMECSGMIAL